MKAPLVIRCEGRFALLTFAATHFLVDLASVFLLFFFFSSLHLFALCLLFYNFFAFAAEMPLGIAVDLWFQPHRFAALGCWLLVCCSLLCASVISVAGNSVLLAVVFSALIGLCNGMFHVGAGAAVIRGSAGKSGPLGIFVAPGALGVFLGVLLGKNGGTLLVVLVLLAGCGALIWTLKSADELSFPQARRPLWDSRRDLTLSITSGVAISLSCLAATVVLRSYAGFSFSFSWKTGAIWPLVLVLGVVLGKILGGLLGDRLGLRVAAVVSLGGAALSFLFPSVPVLGVLAVLLFNMTMPLTLRAIADRLPQTPGFAFGILTFALFIGALPVLLGMTQIVRPGWSLALLALMSLIFLMGGLLLSPLQGSEGSETDVLERER